MRASRSGEDAAAEASLERKGSRGFKGGIGRMQAERGPEEAIGIWAAEHRSTGAPPCFRRSWTVFGDEDDDSV